MFRARPIYKYPIRGRSNNCESSEFRTYALCPGNGDPGSSHVYNAVESDSSISTSISECPAQRHRPNGHEFPFLWISRYDDMARVGIILPWRELYWQHDLKTWRRHKPFSEEDIEFGNTAPNGWRQSRRGFEDTFYLLLVSCVDTKTVRLAFSHWYVFRRGT